ncbi:hypothetical protein [Nonomuraea sp. NPDC049309]|uniref:hypothetical protein n=1 Tax=Nonomuraea sp. NPDC049309 TaxID=3364350 RepID=UPI00371FD77E
MDLGTDIAQLLDPFLANGWRKTIPAHEDAGAAFVAGVEVERDGKTLYVTVGRIEGSETLDVRVDSSLA